MPASAESLAIVTRDARDLNDAMRAVQDVVIRAEKRADDVTHNSGFLVKITQNVAAVEKLKADSLFDCGLLCHGFDTYVSKTLVDGKLQLDTNYVRSRHDVITFQKNIAHTLLPRYQVGSGRQPGKLGSKCMKALQDFDAAFGSNLRDLAMQAIPDVFVADKAFWGNQDGPSLKVARKRNRETFGTEGCCTNLAKFLKMLLNLLQQDVEWTADTTTCIDASNMVRTEERRIEQELETARCALEHVRNGSNNDLCIDVTTMAPQFIMALYKDGNAPTEGEIAAKLRECAVTAAQNKLQHWQLELAKVRAFKHTIEAEKLRLSTAHDVERDHSAMIMALSIMASTAFRGKDLVGVLGISPTDTLSETAKKMTIANALNAVSLEAAAIATGRQYDSMEQGRRQKTNMGAKEFAKLSVEVQRQVKAGANDEVQNAILEAGVRGAQDRHEYMASKLHGSSTPFLRPAQVDQGSSSSGQLLLTHREASSGASV